MTIVKLLIIQGLETAPLMPGRRREGGRGIG
jgi:hypothetical protein